MQPQQPNAFEKSFPMIGGMVGQIAGGALGGLGGFGAGAAVPGADLTGVPEVAGGIAGEQIGQHAGATAGGALGQGIEDWATHNLNGGTLGRVAASGIENGIGSLAGGALNWLGGKALNGATGFLSGLAAKRAEQAATDQATQSASQAATDAAAAVEAKANAYKNNYGSISDRLQRDLNLGTNAKTVDSMGFDSTDPTQMKTVSNAGLDLNKIYDTALQGAKPVNISDEVLGPIKQAIADKQPTDSIGLPMRQALADNHISMDEQTLQNLPATQVRQVQQSIGTQIGNSQRIINNAEQMGIHNVEEEANLKNLQDLYQQLGSKIKTPEVDAAIAGSTVSDAERQALVAKYGDTLGNNTADTINSAQSANDLLKPMQSYTQMSHAADMAMNDINNAVGTARAVARTKADIPDAAPVAKPGNPANGVLDALSMGLALPTHGASLLGLIPHAAQMASNPAVQEAAFNGLTKLQGSNLATTIAPALTKLGAIAGANIPNMGGQPQPNPEMSNPGNPSQQSTNGGAGMQPAAQPQQPLSPLEQFVLQQQNIQSSLAGQEQKAPLALQGLGTAAAGMTGSIGALMPQVQQQQQASSVLQGLMPSYEQAGGAQGPVGGAMSQLNGMIPGTAANEYGRSQQAAAATLAQLLHISPEQAMQMLPQLTQGQGTAQVPIGAVQGVLGNIGPSNPSALAGL